MWLMPTSNRWCQSHRENCLSRNDPRVLPSLTNWLYSSYTDTHRATLGFRHRPSSMIGKDTSALSCLLQILPPLATPPQQLQEAPQLTNVLGVYNSSMRTNSSMCAKKQSAGH